MSDHVSELVFLFSCPKNPSINHLNFYCIKQLDEHFSVCVYCNKEQLSRHSTSSRVVLFCDLLQYTCTHTIYLLNMAHSSKCTVNLPDVASQIYIPLLTIRDFVKDLVIVNRIYWIKIQKMTSLQNISELIHAKQKLFSKHFQKSDHSLV